MPESTAASSRSLQNGKRSRKADRLSRHQNLHGDLQLFSCGVCEKSFRRKDSVVRHVLTHSNGPSLLEKRTRACRACANSKLRCSGAYPCARCSTKAIECTFPSPSARNGPNPSTPSAHIPDSTTSEDSPGIVRQPSIHTSDTCNGPETSSEPSVPNDRSTLCDGGVQDPVLDDNNTSIQSQSHPLEPSDSRSNDYSGIRHLPSPQPTDQRTFDSAQFAPQHRPSNSGRLNSSSPNYTNSWTWTVNTIQTSPAVNSSVSQQMEERDGLYISERSRRRTGSSVQKDRPGRCLGPRYLKSGWNLACVPSLACASTTEPYFADSEYNAMYQAFVRLCIDCSSITEPFSTSDFPPREVFDLLIYTFHTRVHQSLPFVHWPTFHPDHESRWILLLAMASISCWYIEEKDAEDFAESLLEFLRRVILFQDVNNGWRVFTNCRHAQIILLLLLSALASKHENVELWNDRWTGELYSLVRSIVQSYAQGLNDLSKDTTVNEWLVWAEDEQTIRTAFIVWQISLFRSLQKTDTDRPAVTLSQIASLRMPCTDAVFEARDATEWREIAANLGHINFLEAIQNLYTHRKSTPDVSDLSHLLLIYGVIQRTREIQDYVQQPLFCLEPLAVGENSPVSSPIHHVWAPSAPIYTKWRNLGVDCLNILHWQANAATSMAGGFEPTKVLHLHLARIFVLAPLNHLLDFARMVQFTRSLACDSNSLVEVELRQLIQKWATSDQHTARLAAFHAGGIFWHVRRYSTDAFYEPLAVLGATLTLWALSAFICQTRSPAEVYESNTHGIILIDRPTDDELVQQFIHHGMDMQVVMQGVGDLWAPTAPSHILREGRGLLNNLGPWYGETERYITLLDGLIGAHTKDV